MLQDITVSAVESYEKAAEFNGTTNCVTSMLLFELPRDFQIEKYQKIIVEVGGEKSDFFELENNIIQINKPFEFEHYWKLSDAEAKRCIAHLVLEEVGGLCDRLSVNKAPLNESFKINEEKEFKFEYVYSTAYSKNKERRASLCVQYGRKNAKILVEVYDKSGNVLGTVDVETTLPHELMFAQYLGKVSWINDKRLKITPHQKVYDQYIVDLP
ncbi:hypothetical protein [Hahella ganghwensis]|uniref:hypothetical protein n=1 Tax=Hahella ganghwensis TaxID=286420 RepID=UPI00036FFF65|nr:hypothetical protein [Hahella ganghwensis]